MRVLWSVSVRESSSNRLRFGGGSPPRGFCGSTICFVVEGAGLGRGGNCAAEGDGTDEEARRDGSRRSAVSVGWERFWGIVAVGGEGRLGEDALALKPEPGGGRLIGGRGEGVVLVDPPAASLGGILLPADELALSFLASTGVSAFLLVLGSFRGIAGFLTSGTGMGEARLSVWVGVVLRVILTRSVSPAVGREGSSTRYCVFKVHT